ncbi:MAG: ATP-binding protein [Nanoarchaeota archaeon]
MKELVWYKKIGFHNNPFSIKPAAFNDSLFGVEDTVSEILKLIRSNKCCFIAGEYGSGKTSVLKRIINEFRGKGKVIYHSFSTSSQALNMNKLLVGRSSFIKRVFNIKAKNVIILLDEIQDMTLKDAKQVKEHHNNKHFQSVLFVAKQLDNKMPQEVKDLVEDRIFIFKGLKDDDAVKLVRKRVGKIKIISDDIIGKINQRANNPRDLLKNMEDIFRHAIENDEKKIDEKTISAVLDT